MKPHRRSRLRRLDCLAQIALLPILFALVASCGDSTLVLVSVGKIPAGANRLIAEARLGQTQFLAAPSFEIDPAQIGTDGRYSFGLRVHDRESGKLQVSIAALVETGADATRKLCLLSTAQADVALTTMGNPPLDIDLSGERLDGSGCNSALPIVQRATQELVGNTVRLVTEGFGFAPGSELLVDGAVQPFVVNESPLKLYSDVPSVSAPSGARPVGIALRLPDGALSNAVSFIASEPWYVGQPTPSFAAGADQNGVEIYTGVTTGDYNNDKLIDVAVSGYVWKDGKAGSGFVDVFLGTGRDLGGAQHIRSVVWNNTAVGDPQRISAMALVTTNYRQRSTPDLIVAISDEEKARGGYAVLSNDGTGHFAPTALYVLDAAYPSPSAILHVDVNGAIDTLNHPDVVLLSTAADGSSALNIFLSDSGGNIGTTLYWNIGIGGKVSGLSAVDVNSDGAPDFAFIGTGTNDASKPQVHVVMNYRDGKIWKSYVDTTSMLQIEAFGGAVIGANLYPNDHMNLIASNDALQNAPTASLRIVRNQDPPSGMRPSDAPVSATPPKEPNMSLATQTYAAGARPHALAAVDADHDGLADIAAALTGDSTQPTRITILRHYRITNDNQDVLPGGPGQPASLPTLILWGEIGEAMLAVDDITGDTLPDLIAVTRGDGAAGRPGSVWFFRNQ